MLGVRFIETHVPLFIALSICGQHHAMSSRSVDPYSISIFVIAIINSEDEKNCCINNDVSLLQTAINIFTV